MQQCDWKLRSFQNKDLKSMGNRTLLAYEQGLGKTITSISHVIKRNCQRVIVVCPKGLKHHWCKELKDKFKEKGFVVGGRKPTALHQSTKRLWIIINYDILGPWLESLKNWQPDGIIFDECQMLGNLNAARTQHAMQLVKGIPVRMMLSGTPLTSRPWELFPTLHMLWPKTFNSPFSYGMEYCNATNDFGTWDFSGHRNLKKLHSLLVQNGMFRRTKLEVAKDLPPLIRQVMPVEMETPEEYLEAERDLIAWLSKYDLGRANRAKRNERRVKLTYLKQLAGKLKIKAVLEVLKDMRPSMTGKLLIGVWHRSLTQLLLKTFPNAAVIDGSKTEKQRRDAEDRFQNGDCMELIGQLKACGTGLNLTAASTVATIEYAWTPGTHQQFEARPHRLTTKNPVHSIYFVAKDTIEERICDLLQRKARVLSTVLDGKGDAEQNLNLMDELTLYYKQKK